MAKGKYAEYYWYTKKEKEGWIWQIKSDWRKGAEVLQSSIESDDEDERYFLKESDARYDAKINIREYYS